MERPTERKAADIYLLIMMGQEPRLLGLSANQWNLYVDSLLSYIFPFFQEKLFCSLVMVTAK